MQKYMKQHTGTIVFAGGAFLLSMECIGKITTNFIVTYMPSTWL